MKKNSSNIEQLEKRFLNQSLLRFWILVKTNYYLFILYYNEVEKQNRN